MAQPWVNSGKRYRMCRERTPLLSQASGFPRRTSHTSVNRWLKGTCLQRTGWGVTKRFFTQKERLRAEWKGREDFTGLNLSAVHLLGTAHLFTRPQAAVQHSVPCPTVHGGWPEGKWDRELKTAAQGCYP